MNNNPTKIFSINLVTLILLYVLNIIIGILVARILGVSEKGVYSVILLFPNTMSLLLMFGVNNGILYHLSAKKYSIENSLFSIVLLSIIMGVLILFFISLLKINQYFKSISNIYFSSFVIALIAIPAKVLFYNLSAVFKALGLFNQFNIFQIFSSLLYLGYFGYAFAFKSSITFQTVIAVYSSLVFVLVFVMLFYLIMKYKIRVNLNASFIKECYRYGFKSWIGNLSNVANDRFDMFLLGAMSEPSVVGVYSVGYSFVKLLNLVPFALMPIFYNKVAASRNALADLFKVHGVFFYLMLLAATFFMLLVSNVLVFIYGIDFEQARVVVYYLVPVAVLYFTTRLIILDFFMAQNKPLLSSKLELASFLISFVFYVFLIPKYELYGAIWGSFFGFLAPTVLSIVFLVNEEESDFRMIIKNLYSPSNAISEFKKRILKYK